MIAEIAREIKYFNFDSALIPLHTVTILYNNFYATSRFYSRFETIF